jgi:hypothetical protein
MRDARMQFDRDHFAPGERGREHAGRTDVDDQLAGPDSGLGDDRLGPAVSESVPAPRDPRGRGHGSAP